MITRNHRSMCHLAANSTCMIRFIRCTLYKRLCKSKSSRITRTDTTDCKRAWRMHWHHAGRSHMFSALWRLSSQLLAQAIWTEPLTAATLETKLPWKERKKVCSPSLICHCAHSADDSNTSINIPLCNEDQLKVSYINMVSFILGFDLLQSMRSFFPIEFKSRCIHKKSRK